ELEEADHEGHPRDPADREGVGEDDAPIGNDLENHSFDRRGFAVGSTHHHRRPASGSQILLDEASGPRLRCPPFLEGPGPNLETGFRWRIDVAVDRQLERNDSRHSAPSAAASRPAMSSLTILSIASPTRLAIAPSRSVINVPSTVGTICHERPYLSF